MTSSRPRPHGCLSRKGPGFPAWCHPPHKGHPGMPSMLWSLCLRHWGYNSEQNRHVHCPPGSPPTTCEHTSLPRLSWREHQPSREACPNSPHPCIGGEGNGSPLQYSRLENPMDRGAWWATVRGVEESQTTEQLSPDQVAPPPASSACVVMDLKPCSTSGPLLSISPSGLESSSHHQPWLPWAPSLFVK